MMQNLRWNTTNLAKRRVLAGTRESHGCAYGAVVDGTMSIIVYTVDFMISRSRMLEAIANQPSPTKVNRDEHAQTKQTLDINATTDISLDIESKSKVHIGDGRHQLNS